MDTINLDALLPNGEWDITSTEAKYYRYPSTYRPGTFHTGVNFVVHLRRKRFFYVLNTIIPVVMLSCLNVLVFILPSDCGERMALAVTVLLAFTVYLGIISDNIPKTSESLSLLAIYLTSLLALSTASVVCAGIVLNIHYRDPNLPVPACLKWIYSSVKARPETSWNSDSLAADHTRYSRSSFIYRDKRPMYWDQRRPSVWTRRLTLRESRASREQRHDEMRDGAEDTSSEAFVTASSIGCPSFEYDSKPLGTLESTDNENDPDNEAVDKSNHSNADRRSFKVSSGRARDTLGRAKKVSYDRIPFMERGVAFQNARRQADDLEMDNRPGSRRGHVTPTLETTPGRLYSTEVRNHRPPGSGAQSCEGRRLPSDSGSADNKHDGKHEVTWHDIGNSLDRSLFWVFFLLTNTVTVVIMVLFVSADT